MPRATTQVWASKCTPSTINATRSSPDRSAASSWASAVSVAATNDTADFDVDMAAWSVRVPTGSSTTG